MVKFFRIKEKARGLARQQKYDLALVEYRAAIALAEAEADTSALRNLYNAAGDASLLNSDAAGAVDFFDRAADLYLQEGLYDNAIALCHKILRHVPTKADVYGKLGRIYAEKGLRNEAIQNWLEYAERREKAGDAPAVIRGLREVVALSPEADAVRSRLTEALLAQREPVEALEHLEWLRRRADLAGERERANDFAGRIAGISGEYGLEAPAGADAAEPPPEVARAESAPPGPAVESAAPEARPPAGAEAPPDLEGFGLVSPPEPSPAAAREDLPGLDSGFGFGPEGPSLAPPGEEAPAPRAARSGAETPARRSQTAAGKEDLAPVGSLPGFTAPEGPFDVEEPPFVPVEERISRAETRLAERPHDAEERIYLAELYQESGAIDLARAAMEQGAAELFGSGQHDKAYRAYRRLAALVPGETEVMQKLVEVAHATGSREDLLESHHLLADRLMEAGEYGRASEIHRKILEIDPGHRRSQDQLLILDGLEARAGVVAGGGSHAPDVAAVADYVDLELLIANGDTSSAADPRMVAHTRPTGDDEADLQAIIDEFRRGVALNIEEGDHQSHYDLGVAFRQMGLLDEAVREFQLAARGPEHRGRAFELMGLCFMEKGMVSVAVNCFRRGIAEERDFHQALGLHYHLARSLEEMGNPAEARAEYEQVVALDVQFMDAAERLRGLV